LCQSCLVAETRSATNASHLLLAGLPPLAIFGLALVTPLALLVLLDPAAKQRIREQGLQVVILYLAAPVGIACPSGDILHDDGLINPSFGHTGSSFSLLLAGLRFFHQALWPSSKTQRFCHQIAAVTMAS
jgi:hypothetical protein